MAEACAALQNSAARFIRKCNIHSAADIILKCSIFSASRIIQKCFKSHAAESGAEDMSHVRVVIVIIVFVDE